MELVLAAILVRCPQKLSPKVTRRSGVPALRENCAGLFCRGLVPTSEVFNKIHRRCSGASVRVDKINRLPPDEFSAIRTRDKSGKNFTNNAGGFHSGQAFFQPVTFVEQLFVV